MMKQSLNIAMIAALSVSLAACGGNKGTSTASPGATAQQSGGSSKPVEITFWDMGWGPAKYVDTAKKLVEQFNTEHPNMKVSYQSIPWNASWYQTFANAIASGSPPDISTGAGYQAFQFSDTDQILPIDDVIEDLKKSGKLDDFTSGSVEALKYNGHYVALPWMIDVRVPFYRKDLFEKAGITAQPKNWDELRADLKKLTGDGKYGMDVAGNDTLGIHTLINVILNNGGGLFTADKKVNLLSDRNVEAVQYLADLVKDGVINPASTGFNKDNITKDFANGTTAFTYNSLNLKGSVPEIADKIGVLEPIAGPHGEKQALGWVNNIMIYKQSKHPNEAKEFLKWWSDNNKVLFTEGSAGLPARKSFAQDPYFQNDPILKVIANSYLPIVKTTGNLYPSGFPELNQIEGDGSMTQLVQKILTGKPVRDSLKEADQKLREIMK